MRKSHEHGRSRIGFEYFFRLGLPPRCRHLLSEAAPGSAATYRRPSGWAEIQDLARELRLTLAPHPAPSCIASRRAGLDTNARYRGPYAQAGV